MMFCQFRIGITDASQAGEVRREANRLAAAAGFDEGDQGKVSIIASELATNLHRYAKDGEVLLRSYAIGGSTGMEVLAIDRGPGMVNVAKCLEDGYSTGGTPGNGLGAVRRLATQFDIFSSQPSGTIVLARLQKMTEALPALIKPVDWGAINRPAPHETLCGDTWRLAQRNGELALMVVDGLGHGPQAADAATTAARVFDGDSFATPAGFLTTVDRSMRGTRGAAIAVAQVNTRVGKVQFAGIGNIAGSLRSRESTKGRGLVSHNGTVGVEVRKVQQFDYDYSHDSLLILHSDGLQGRWSFDAYPGLIDRHPAVVASVLYRDFCRGRDDVTVCVIRCPLMTAV